MKEPIISGARKYVNLPIALCSEYFLYRINNGCATSKITHNIETSAWKCIIPSFFILDLLAGNTVKYVL